MSRPLTLLSLLSDNAAPFAEGLGAWLAERLGLLVRLLPAPPTPDAGQRLLEQGTADLALVCGLVYVRARAVSAPVELIAAPVADDPRALGQPVYFADLVVRADDPARTLADLRGATFAFNEPGSFSGYAALRHALGARGEAAGFFGRAVETGSHLGSLDQVLGGKADVCAIDSTVLAIERLRRPALAGRLRLLESLGPFAAPPLVGGPGLCGALGEAARAALLGLHAAAGGAALLARAALARLGKVTDADYNGIRRAARAAHGVRLVQAAPAPGQAAAASVSRGA